MTGPEADGGGGAPMRPGGPNDVPVGGARPEAAHPLHPLARLARLAGADDGLPIDPDLDPDDPAEPSRAHVPATTPVHRMHPATIAAIGAGGFAGTVGRYELGLAWPTPSGGFPSATLVINTSGAFLLGLVLTLLVEHVHAPRTRHHVRHFACVGVLGSWTTMSTFAVQSDGLVRSDRPWLALAYVAATVAAGIVAAGAGIVLGRIRGVRRTAPAVEASSP